MSVLESSRCGARQTRSNKKNRAAPESVKRDPAWLCHNHFRATKAAKPSARCALLFGARHLRTGRVRPTVMKQAAAALGAGRRSETARYSQRGVSSLVTSPSGVRRATTRQAFDPICRLFLLYSENTSNRIRGLWRRLRKIIRASWCFRSGATPANHAASRSGSFACGDARRKNSGMSND